MKDDQEDNTKAQRDNPKQSPSDVTEKDSQSQDPEGSDNPDIQDVSEDEESLSSHIEYSLYASVLVLFVVMYPLKEPFFEIGVVGIGIFILCGGVVFVSAFYLLAKGYETFTGK